MSASPLVLPPVRLLPADDLARLALAAPLLDRALRLTRWAAPYRDVDAMGELTEADLAAAAAELGLADEEGGLADTALAWGVAVDTGLLTVDVDEGAVESTGTGEPAGRAVPGETFVQVEKGDADEILDLWLSATESALAEAAALDLESLRGAAGDEPADPEPVGRDAAEDSDGAAADGAARAGRGARARRGVAGDERPPLEDTAWDPEEEAEFLDSALVNLYALTAMDAAVPDAQRPQGGAVPLPVLAASLVVPEEMEQPSDAVLEEVTEVMMRLDGHFRLLTPTGLLDYQPVDETLIEEDGEPDAAAADLEDLDPEEISRYGMVKLTPLGLHGMRERLNDAGASAPAVGELAARPAAELLASLTEYPEQAAREEAQLWLGRRQPGDAARELLAASRGDDEPAPQRRLIAQQSLALLGAEAEPAVREVLDDRQLGGLARVWLTERGAADVPAPDQAMVFWLTVDTLAAQLASGDDPELLAELVRDLVARHDGFFDQAWRVDHPATAEVLEAMGRLHPDRKAAKEARKAAFKARSRSGAPS
ncbi:hypothetical protein VSR01_07510 [Actinacidiphila sp. DG2A-62]|uniref:hypothetical protein n=1 Tax=Actinacidiphila sp. DG2A-62 TaxID=3108821 RepID=UPI002DB7E57C|nr:hypothetical protein [Actinacidiphila sp. DG2A-62]MEC3993397.1 hypothetical protein [Actinacidiphila sp. DG2A-62]